MSRHESRVLAFQALYAWELQGSPEDWTPDFSWTEKESDYALLLVRACMEHRDILDGHISRNLDKWDIKRLGKVELSILRLGAYGILYQTEVDPRVTLDEAVIISKDYGQPETYKLVNAVLDAIMKSQPGHA